MLLLVLPLFLTLATIACCRPDARLLMTPAPALPTPLLHPRQFDSSELAQTCGYIDAYILSPLGCFQGSVCVEEKTLGLAGGCCRLADVSSNCFLPTACVPQASLSVSCDAACSSDIRVTKCDDAKPYCYTNYWVSDGSTPTEVGCTTTQGFFAYVYSGYTTPGSNFSPTTRNSPIPQTATTSSGVSQTVGSGTSQQTSSSTNDQASASGRGTTTNNSNAGDSSGSSVPVGAIAGGVVGGVAVLAIAAGLITWMCLRHRREKRGKTGSNAGASGTPADGVPMQGVIARKPVPEQHVTTHNTSAELPHDQNYRPNEVVSNEKAHAHELLGRRAIPELP